MNLAISSWIAILSAIWLFFHILGRWQFNRIKQVTLDLIMTEGRQATRLHQRPTVEELYAQILPTWEALLKKNAWFILHKSELFPVPAWPAIVRNRMIFTPAWMGAYLRVNGMKLPASIELEAEIERIVALVPKKKTVKS